MHDAIPLTAVHGRVSTYSHHGCRCPACSEASSQYHRARYQRNRDKRLAQVKARYAANSEAIAAQQRARYAANREREQLAARVRYERNSERMRACAMRWAANNPGKLAESRARRRTRMASADLRLVTERDWRRARVRYGDRCAYCRNPGPLSQDHIVPLVRGGRHSIGNLIPACKSCNSRKRHRTIMEWRMTQLALGKEWGLLWLSA